MALCASVRRARGALEATAKMRRIWSLEPVLTVAYQTKPPGPSKLQEPLAAWASNLSLPTAV